MKLRLLIIASFQLFCIFFINTLSQGQTAVVKNKTGHTLYKDCKNPLLIEFLEFEAEEQDHIIYMCHGGSVIKDSLHAHKIHVIPLRDDSLQILVLKKGFKQSEIKFDIAPLPDPIVHFSLKDRDIHSGDSISLKTVKPLIMEIRVEKEVAESVPFDTRYGLEKFIIALKRKGKIIYEKEIHSQHADLSELLSKANKGDHIDVFLAEIERIRYDNSIQKIMVKEPLFTFNIKD